MELRTSGTVLSFAMYDMAQSPADLEGLVYGHVQTQTRRSTADSQETSVEQHRVLSLHTLTPTGKPLSFYNAKGEISEATFNSFVKSDSRVGVVGWFKFRRNTSLRMSYRERLVHLNLLKFLGRASEDFVFMIFSSNATPNRSTHTSPYCAMTCNATASRLHKINIVNLDQTSHDGYGALSIPTVLSNATNTNQNAANPTESDAYTSILAGLEALVSKESSGKTTDAVATEKVYTNAVARIKELSAELTATASQIDVLEEEVNQLRRQAHDTERSTPPLDATA